VRDHVATGFHSLKAAVRFTADMKKISRAEVGARADLAFRGKARCPAKEKAQFGSKGRVHGPGLVLSSSATWMN